MIKLIRQSNQPILNPAESHNWEKSAVFNTAAVYHDGKFHLIYRATDLPGNEHFEYVSSLGYAFSNDGFHFERYGHPVMTGEGLQEKRGIEDPRVVCINGIFYMMYTAYGARFDGDYRISMASSTNLVDWERHGIVLDEPNKDASLFPCKIGGRYVLLHRRFPHIWLAFSDDLKNWTDHTPIMSPIPGSWDSERVGIAGPPIETERGWLLIYHGVDDRRVYRLGAAMLDASDPRKVIARQAEPILEPELDWEKHGWVPNVVFSTGQIVKDGTVYVYYAGADSRIGVATAPLAEFLNMRSL